VKVANWLSHLEFDWESPVWRHWMRELSRDNTLIRYDERGCGLSDWNATEFSVDVWVRDLEAVVDALELETFPLLGISQGGPVALTYASRHPERVTRLVLYGTYAQGRRVRATSQDEIDEHEALITLSRLCWGRDDPSFRQLFVTKFIPGASAEQQRWFNDLCRVSTSPENSAHFRHAFGNIDVSELLAEVSVPTLVLHALSDQGVPAAEGQSLAASIPGARFVPLLGNNHILLEDEPAWPRFLSEVRGFLAA
jgi:pimeloyl-ACP methyl ester carboxylesterase